MQSAGLSPARYMERRVLLRMPILQFSFFHQLQNGFMKKLKDNFYISKEAMYHAIKFWRQF